MPQNDDETHAEMLLRRKDAVEAMTWLKGESERPIGVADRGFRSGMRHTRFEIESLECRALLSDVGNIFIANSVTHGVSETSTAGTLINSDLIAGVGASGIAVSGPDLFLTNAAAGTVAEYTTGGQLLNSALITGLNAPGGVAVFGRRLFVADATGVGEYTKSGQTIKAKLITEPHGAGAIHIFGSNLLVNTGETIAEFSMTGATINPSLVTVGGSVDGDYGDGYSINDFTVSGNDLFIATSIFAIIHPFALGSGVIEEFTTSGTLVNPSLVSATATNDYASESCFCGIAAFGSSLYLTDNADGLISQYSLSGVLQGTVEYLTGVTDVAVDDPICIETEAGPATQLVPFQPPEFVSIGSAVSPPIIVAVEDANGNLVTNGSSTITLAAANGASIGGTLSQPVVDGLAIFSDITFPSGGSYKLTASNGTLPAATFSVTAGDPAPVVTASTVPARVVAGVAIHARQSITVTNDSNFVEKGFVDIRIYATMDGAVDQSATLVATRPARIAIKPGGHLVVPIPIASLPAGLAGGQYTLLAQTTDPAGIVYTSPAGPTVNVVPPVVTLQEAIATPSVPKTVIANKRSRAVIQVEMTNSGTIVSHGRTTIAMYLSSTEGVVNDSPAILARLTRSLRIAPGKTFTLKIPMGEIPNLPDGAYSLVVQLTDATGQISSTDYSPVTVQG